MRIHGFSSISPKFTYQIRNVPVGTPVSILFHQSSSLLTQEFSIGAGSALFTFFVVSSCHGD